jgi:replicative DNA helicase
MSPAQLADRLAPEDFYRRDHQLIYQAIGELSEKGHPCDAVTVSEHLETAGTLEDAGGLA